MREGRHFQTAFYTGAHLLSQVRSTWERRAKPKTQALLGFGGLGSVGEK
jgi:hypothetical protein